MEVLVRRFEHDAELLHRDSHLADRFRQFVQTLANSLPHLLTVGRRLTIRGRLIEGRLLTIRQRLAVEHLLAVRRSPRQRALRNDRFVAKNFVERTHGPAELGHRLFRRVQQSLDAALLGFGAERFIDPTRLNWLLRCRQRPANGSPTAKSVLRSASCASASNGFGSTTPGMVAPSASGCGGASVSDVDKINRRIAQHGGAHVRHVAGQQPSVSVDVHVQNYAIVQIVDRSHAADQQAVLADRCIRARRRAPGEVEWRCCTSDGPTAATPSAPAR